MNILPIQVVDYGEGWEGLSRWLCRRIEILSQQISWWNNIALLLCCVVIGVCTLYIHLHSQISYSRPLVLSPASLIAHAQSWVAMATMCSKQCPRVWAEDRRTMSVDGSLVGSQNMELSEARLRRHRTTRRSCRDDQRAFESPSLALSADDVRNSPRSRTASPHRASPRRALALCL